MVPWSIYILTFLYNFTFGALVGESPRAGAILSPHGMVKPLPLEKVIKHVEKVEIQKSRKKNLAKQAEGGTMTLNAVSIST